MKKTVLIVALALVCAAPSALAKGFVHFGVTGGITSTQTVADLKAVGFDKAAISDWNAGVALKFKDILGLSIQPSLIYASKSNVVGEEGDAQSVKSNYLQLPVQVQYGINLFGIRPYIFAEPFLGYCLSTSVADVASAETAQWSGFGDLEYGLGAGIGVNLWFLQVSVRYSWGLGKVGDFDFDKVKESVGEKAVGLIDSYKNNSLDNMFNGLSISAAIFF